MSNTFEYFNNNELALKVIRLMLNILSKLPQTYICKVLQDTFPQHIKNKSTP